MKRVPFETLKLLAMYVEDFYMSNPKRIKFQHSPLHIAAEHGFLSLFEFIYERVGVKNPNPARDDGTTALYMAAQGGHSEICKMIIENVENKNPVDNDGKTPKDIAIGNGHLDIAQLF